MKQDTIYVPSLDHPFEAARTGSLPNNSPDPVMNADLAWKPILYVPGERIFVDQSVAPFDGEMVILVAGPECTSGYWTPARGGGEDAEGFYQWNTIGRHYTGETNLGTMELDEPMAWMPMPDRSAFMTGTPENNDRNMLILYSGENGDDYLVADAWFDRDASEWVCHDRAFTIPESQCLGWMFTPIISAEDQARFDREILEYREKFSEIEENVKEPEEQGAFERNASSVPPQTSRGDYLRYQKDN